MKLPLSFRTSSAVVSPMMSGAFASVGGCGRAGRVGEESAGAGRQQRDPATKASPRDDLALRHRADAASFASNSRSAKDTGMVPP